MIKNFMTSESLTRNKVRTSGKKGTTPFPWEEAVITVYNGHPATGRRRMSKLSLRTPTHCSQGPGNVVM
jgi:hypothetical protein